MRTNKRTIKLAEIRRLIRKACHYYKVDDGVPDSWTSLSYSRARPVKRDKFHIPIKNYPYYLRSTRAIEDIAQKILRLSESGEPYVWECERCGRKAPHKFFAHAMSKVSLSSCDGKVRRIKLKNCW
jgi:hypothetical protein